MKKIRILRGDEVIASKVMLCDNIISQLRGLMFSNFKEQDGALLSFGHDGYHGIHMFFVSKPLWIYWLDRNYVVIDKKLAKTVSLNPATWIVYSPKKPARHVLELQKDLLAIDDKVQIYAGSTKGKRFRE